MGIKTLATIILVGSLYLGYNGVKNKLDYHDTSEYKELYNIKEITIDPNHDWTSKSIFLKEAIDTIPKSDRNKEIFKNLKSMIDDVYNHRFTVNHEYPYTEKMENVWIKAQDEISETEDENKLETLLGYVGTIGSVFFIWYARKSRVKE